jgi:hypothetical protein
MKNENPISLAIRVDKIVTKVNRRFVKASRAYSLGSGGRTIDLSRKLFTKVRYYGADSLRREAALLAFAPRNLSDDALRAAMDEALEGAWAMAEMVAEDSSEAAMFGDGPVGSMSRRHKLWEINATGEALRAEWARRRPAPESAPVIFDETEIPF